MRQIVARAGKRNLYFGHRQFRSRVATALQKRQHSPALQTIQGGRAMPASLPTHWLANCHCFAKAPTQPGVADQ